MQAENILLTVFTPTFNRVQLLPKLYQCLLDQTFRRFEWLIVDGGDDGSDRLVELWQREEKISIRYIRQNSKGLHGAYNDGAYHAIGELFLVIHSDDSCVPETLMIFSKVWEDVPCVSRQDLSGIWGRCMDLNGKMIGPSFGVKTLKTSYHQMLFGRGFSCEMFPMVRTSVMREFPFPILEGARFIPEGFVWSAIGLKYDTLFIDIPLRRYTSIDDVKPGNDKLTDPAVLQKNSGAILLYYRTTLVRDIGWWITAPLMFFRIAAAYSYYSFISGKSIADQLNALPLQSVFIYLIAFPVGFCKYLGLRLKSEN